MFGRLLSFCESLWIILWKVAKFEALFIPGMETWIEKHIALHVPAIKIALENNIRLILIAVTNLRLIR